MTISGLKELMDAAKSRHEEMQARFKSQQEARAQSRKELKAQSDEARAPGESVDRFWDEVRSTSEGIEDELETLRIDFEAQKIEAEGTQESILKLITRANDMQKRLTDATIYLPPYDVRRAQEEIDAVNAKIEQARAAFAPRKRFAFSKKSKKPASTPCPTAASGEDKVKAEQAVLRKAVEPATSGASASGPTPASAAQTAPAASAPTAVEMPGFSGCKDQVLDLATLVGASPEGDCVPKDVLLRDLAGCTVKMCEALTFVRMENLKDCRVYCGPVAGPVYVESCSGCTFVLASRQLRIHNTTSTEFYVHVMSGPIIEDCKGLRFAPYCLSYSGLEAHFKESDLAGSTNEWADVKDFKWLRAQKSPNWDVIPEPERAGTIKLEGTDSSSRAGAEDEDEL